MTDTCQTQTNLHRKAATPEEKVYFAALLWYNDRNAAIIFYAIFPRLRREPKNMAALYHCASRHGIITKRLLRRRRRRTPGCVRAEGGERHQREQKRKTRQAAGLHPGSYRPVLCPRRRPGRCGFDLLFALCHFPAAGVRQHPGGLDGSRH